MSSVKAIFFKELKVEFRNKAMINTSLILSLMILSSFRFAFASPDFAFVTIAAPILWITFFFSGMFSLAQTYRREVDQGTIEGILISPVSPAAIYFGKVIANLIVVGSLEMVSLIIFFAFFPVDIPDPAGLLVIIASGTIGFIALGNLISAIAAKSSHSEVMLPVLLVPLLLFTIVMSAVSATSKLFAGSSLMDLVDEVRFILGFDVIFLAIGYLAIDYVLED